MRPLGPGDDPLDDTRPNGVRWSRVNMTEAIPGVPTPLDWTFWATAFATCSAAIFHRVGVLSSVEARRSADRIEDEIVTCMAGRPVVNVDKLRSLLVRVPGGDPDAFELQMLGSASGAPAGDRRRRRWPLVLARAPMAIAKVPGEVRAARVETEPWWRAATAPGRYPNPAAAAAGLAEAHRRFVAVNTVSGLNLFVGQAAFAEVAKAAAAAGLPGLELELAGTGAGTDETAVVDDIAAAARGALNVEQLVARHGYHGPFEGVLSGSSWREDPAPLAALVERFAERAVAGQPDAASVADRRRVAEERLLAAVPRHRRVLIRLLLRFADRHVPLRETGKAAFLQAIDAGRASARALGAHLRDEGLLTDAEDVFLLTLGEATAAGGPRQIDQAVLQRRREARAQWLTLDVPESFTGRAEPRPIQKGATGDLGAVITGLAASPGTAVGVARVITDPFAAAELAAGEVLVCPLTDPGWAPYLELAAAAVIDVGGVLSHGAIVARELGIPCVIGTGDGTRRIPDGAKVRVDGAAGTIDLLEC